MKRGRIGDVERSIHPSAWRERSDALASVQSMTFPMLCEWPKTTRAA
jgi:hypothetical protein